MERNEVDTILKHSDYVILHRWMFSLGISGIELIVFAEIYKFSQDGQGEFFGSATKLAEKINAARSNVMASLKKLVDKKLLIRTENVINNLSIPRYKHNQTAVENILGGVLKQDRVSQNRTGCPKTRQGVSQNKTGGVSKQDTYIKDYNKEIINTTHTSSSNNNNTYEEEVNVVCVSSFDFKSLISWWNTNCTNLAPIRDFSDKQKSQIEKLHTERSKQETAAVFLKANNNLYLNGKLNNKPPIDIGWLTNPDNFRKVEAGVYEKNGEDDTAMRSAKAQERAQQDKQQAAIKTFVEQTKARLYKEWSPRLKDSDDFKQYELDVLSHIQEVYPTIKTIYL